MYIYIYVLHLYVHGTDTIGALHMPANPSTTSKGNICMSSNSNRTRSPVTRATLGGSLPQWHISPHHRVIGLNPLSSCRTSHPASPIPKCLP